MKTTYDFSGYATKYNIRCSDGRTIRKDAFKDCNGKTVPLVWNHRHDGPENLLIGKMECTAIAVSISPLRRRMPPKM